MLRKAAIEAPSPCMWSVERAQQGDVVVFGRHRFAVADVDSVSGEEVRDSDFDGLLLAAMIVLIAACALAFGVFDGGLGTRFLLGTVFLTFLGFAGLTELRKLDQQSFFEVRITLRSGEPILFASADRADVERLMEQLSVSR